LYLTDLNWEEYKQQLRVSQEAKRWKHFLKQEKCGAAWLDGKGKCEEMG
jgi:hypothetical protein